MITWEAFIEKYYFYEPKDWWKKINHICSGSYIVPIIHIDPSDTKAEKAYIALYRKHRMYEQRKYIRVTVIALAVVLILSICQQLIIAPFFQH